MPNKPVDEFLKKKKNEINNDSNIAPVDKYKLAISSHHKDIGPLEKQISDLINKSSKEADLKKALNLITQAKVILEKEKSGFSSIQQYQIELISHSIDSALLAINIRDVQKLLEDSLKRLIGKKNDSNQHSTFNQKLNNFPKLSKIFTDMIKAGNSGGFVFKGFLPNPVLVPGLSLRRIQPNKFNFPSVNGPINTNLSTHQLNKNFLANMSPTFDTKGIELVLAYQDSLKNWTITQILPKAFLLNRNNVISTIIKLLLKASKDNLPFHINLVSKKQADRLMQLSELQSMTTSNTTSLQQNTNANIDIPEILNQPNMIALDLARLRLLADIPLKHWARYLAAMNRLEQGFSGVAYKVLTDKKPQIDNNPLITDVSTSLKTGASNMPTNPPIPRNNSRTKKTTTNKPIFSNFGKENKRQSNINLPESVLNRKNSKKLSPKTSKNFVITNEMNDDFSELFSLTNNLFLSKDFATDFNTVDKLIVKLTRALQDYKNEYLLSNPDLNEEPKEYSQYISWIDSCKRTANDIKLQKDNLVNSFEQLSIQVSELITQAKVAGTSIEHARTLLTDAKVKINLFEQHVRVSPKGKLLHQRIRNLEIGIKNLKSDISLVETNLKQKENITRKLIEATTLRVVNEVQALTPAKVLTNVVKALMDKKISHSVLTSVLKQISNYHSSMPLLGGTEQTGLEIIGNGLTNHNEQMLQTIGDALAVELTKQGVDALTVQRLQSVLQLIVKDITRVMSGEAEILVIPFETREGIQITYINIPDLLDGKLEAKEMLNNLFFNMALHGYTGDLKMHIVSPVQAATLALSMQRATERNFSLDMSQVNDLIAQVIKAESISNITYEELGLVTTGTGSLVTSANQLLIQARADALKSKRTTPLPETAPIDLMKVLLMIIRTAQELAPNVEKEMRGNNIPVTNQITGGSPVLSITEVGPVYGPEPYFPQFGPEQNQVTDIPPTVETNANRDDNIYEPVVFPTQPKQKTPKELNQEMIERYLNEFAVKILRVREMTTTTPGLKDSHKVDIGKFADKLGKELSVFAKQPGNISFATFKKNCEQHIREAEKQFAKEPFVWGLLKPICNLMITILNQIKALIWSKPSKTSMFKNVAEKAWDTSNIGSDFKAVLENCNLADALQFKEDDQIVRPPKSS